MNSQQTKPNQMNWRPYQGRVELRIVLLMVAAGCMPAMLGCITFGGKGPVPESVANCRQLSQQGVLAMERGRWDQAEIALAQAIEASPSNVEARRQYAETLWHRGSTQQAVEQLEEALKLDNNHAALHVRVGEIYLAMNDLNKARSHSQQALQIDSKLAGAWALRGRIMGTTGNTQQALADFHRALSFMPSNTQLLLETAEIYRLRNQPQRALTTLLHLADIYPPGEEPPQVLHRIGLAYTALHRYDDAVESLYAASVRGPPSAQILCSLGEAELLAGKPVEAEAQVRRALSINPRHEPSQALLSRLETARRPGTPAQRH